MSADPDARLFNWRFVVPDEPDGILLLGVDGESSSAVDAAGLHTLLLSGPYPAVAAADLTTLQRVHRGRPQRLLAEICEAVRPDGWVMVGFANRWFPFSGRRAAMSLGSATRVLHRAGLSDSRVYLPLPDQRHPALLAPAEARAELDYVLSRLFLTYLPGDSWRASLQRRLIALARVVALRSPHRLRVRFAPAYCLVARRSA